MQKLSKVANLLKNDFPLFFELFWDKISADELVLSRHIEFICKELQSIGQRILAKDDFIEDWFIFNVPPGSSKSSIVSIMFPSWLLANDPSLFIINTSYSDTLATGFIRKSKMITQSTAFEEVFGKIELTKDNEGFFETKQAGGRFATSTGGTITGSHSNLIIVDDPLSVGQSYSQAHIDRANRYLTETIPSRVRDKKKVPKILIMQRLNENDPTCMLLNSGLNVKHYCLPAEINEQCTHPELYTDGLLDPIRMSREVLDKFKKFAYSYASQFDQAPAPLDGGIVKKDWFIISKEKHDGRKIVFIDGAYTNNKNNDPTGILITSFSNDKIIIHNYIREWWTLADLLGNMPKIIHQNGLTTSDQILIEPKASGKDIVSMFRREINIATNDYNGRFVKVSKMERLQTSSPYIQQGSVVLEFSHWNDTFINEVCMFPNAKHDEAVDLISYAIEHYILSTRYKKSSIIW